MAQVKCPKCSAPMELDSGTKFAKCSYCGSLIFFDRTGAGFYYAIPFKLSQDDAVGTFRRWAGGSTKAKDLDRLANITAVKKKYFPVYLFRRDLNGKEEVMVEPAGSTILPGLHQLKIPGGDLRIFDDKFDTNGAEMVKPDIEMLHYLDKLPGAGKEQALVYFPIWTIDYNFGGSSYQVVVDASSSEVFATSFPTRSSAAYLLVAVAGFFTFLALGFVATVYFIPALILMAVTVVAVFLTSLTVARRL
ncbi:MAG: zinc ribbon domain-containing protein [Methanomassiliicoccus sp.]|nr:zinc ribbon domain-containing protein [Methanomassiliicoccus sp.]